MDSRASSFTADLKGRRIAVLMGGPGSERQVSLASGAGVSTALRSLGAEVTEVDVRDEAFALPAEIDVAFNVIHGTFGEDGQVQRILEKRGVAYTGEGVMGSELAIDKIATKQRLVQRGVPTAAFEIVRDASKLGEDLREAQGYSRELLIEQFILGRELTVGIVGDQALPIVEIVAKRDFYNFANKYPFLNPNAAGADHFCPAPLSPELTRLVQTTALAAHRALDLEVYSRVDFVLSESGEPFVLEVNTIPGMTPSSLLPEAAAAVGISYAQLCARIIELSLARLDL